MSEQSPDDSSNPIKRSTSPGLLDFLKSEAILVAFASGAAYYFAYSFEKGYLGYFSVGSEFIQLTPADLLVFCSFLSALFLIGWIFLGLVPVRAIEPFFKSVVVGLPAIPLILNALAIYSSSGISWLLLINLLFSLVFIIFLTISLASNIRSGRKLAEWIDNQVQSELQMRDHFATQALLSKLEAFPVAIIALFLLGPVLGNALGHFYADSRRQFQQIVIDDREYVIFADFSDGFLIGGVNALNDGRVLSDGTARWISKSELSKRDTTLVRVSKDGLSGPKTTRHWVTFDMFWEDNFGPVRSERP